MAGGLLRRLSLERAKEFIRAIGDADGERLTDAEDAYRLSGFLHAPAWNPSPRSAARKSALP